MKRIISNVITVIFALLLIYTAAVNTEFGSFWSYAKFVILGPLAFLTAGWIVGWFIKSN